MKCLSPNALISLILPHYELFIEFESHGDNTLKMGKSNSSEKKKMKRPMFCPSPLKKKRRTKKADITSMERIDSYMSNTYLGKMRAAGQIQKAPISRTFFEKNKRKKKKKKKGAKTSAKSDSNLTQLKFLIGKKK